MKYEIGDNDSLSIVEVVMESFEISHSVCLVTLLTY